MTDNLRVTELNFNQIKENLKEYLKSKPEFTDYNFEGAAISRLLDVLAYNTYYNAFYTNMSVNEMFLGTATMRDNVALRARDFGYIPKSARSARARLFIRIVPSDSPNEIVIPKYTKFSSKINGEEFIFQTMQEYIVTNQGGSYSKTIDIYEGAITTYEYSYTGGKSTFQIPNKNVDTTILKVFVKESSTSTNIVEYTVKSKLTDVTPTSNVYYLQQNSAGFYEIYFGDGVLGRALQPGNLVRIEQVVTSGVRANDINQFNPIGSVGFNRANIGVTYSIATLSVESKAEGGADEESADSIRFNATNFYELQDRLVTASDYKNYILAYFNDIQGASVWGGEDNDPPQYGKVMISAKPRTGYVLSAQRKQEIVDRMASMNSLSIEPKMIDPQFVFVNPTIVVNYNSNASTLSADQIFTKISASVKTYESNYLSNFDSSFRMSKFSAMIDGSDESIISNNVESIFLEKRFVPIFNTTLSYKITYNAQLLHPYDGYLGTISSTGFKISGSGDTLYLADDGYGSLYLYLLDSQNRRITYRKNVGRVNYADGIVTLDSFTITDFEGDEIRVFAQMADKDFRPVRNQIILLSYPTIRLFDVNSQSLTTSGVVDVIGNRSPFSVNAVNNTVVF